MRTEKPFWQSKGIALGVLTALIGIAEIVISMLTAGDLSPIGITVAILGVLKVIERVFSHGESIIVN